MATVRIYLPSCRLQSILPHTTHCGTLRKPQTLAEAQRTNTEGAALFHTRGLHIKAPTRLMVGPVHIAARGALHHYHAPAMERPPVSRRWRLPSSVLLPKHLHDGLAVRPAQAHFHLLPLEILFRELLQEWRHRAWISSGCH